MLSIDTCTVMYYFAFCHQLEVVAFMEIVLPEND